MLYILSELKWSSEVNSPIPVHFGSLVPKMSMFTLAISCLTTSNLPWFMNLTFQVPMQYCSLQHWTLLPSPVTPTTGCCFCFGSVSYWHGHVVFLYLSMASNSWLTLTLLVLKSSQIWSKGSAFGLALCSQGPAPSFESIFLFSELL